MWLTALRTNALPSQMPDGTQGQPFNEVITSPQYSATMVDNGWFFWLYEQVRAGSGYYESFKRAADTNGRWPLESIVNVRTPTLFWVWSILPGPRDIVGLYLLLASLAAVSVFATAAHSVRLPFALPACAALCSYLVYFASSITLFAPEQWVGALGVLALASYALSVRSMRWRAWTVLSVGLVVSAVLVRDVIGGLALAGLISAFFGDAWQRRFRVSAWGIGVVTIAAFYVAHYLAARPYLVPGEGLAGFMGNGSVAFLMSGLQYGTRFLGRGGWLPVALAVLGLVGAALLRDPRMRAFALIGAWSRSRGSCLLRTRPGRSARETRS